MGGGCEGVKKFSICYSRVYSQILDYNKPPTSTEQCQPKPKDIYLSQSYTHIFINKPFSLLINFHKQLFSFSKKK